MEQAIIAAAFLVFLGLVIHAGIGQQTEVARANNRKNIEIRRFVAFVDLVSTGYDKDECLLADSIQRGLNTLDANLVQIDQGHPAPYTVFDRGEI